LRYWSGKDINLRRSVPFMVLPVIVLGYVLVSSYPPGVLFALFLAYALSGYVMAAWNWRGRKRQSSGKIVATGKAKSVAPAGKYSL
jgi:CDP-diacylglycerol--serine O-phosphatidyltransferase